MSTKPAAAQDDSILADPTFASVDRGVSITVRFDDNTHPKRLDWIKANDAKKWSKILAVKTGLGSIIADPSIKVTIHVRSDDEDTVTTPDGTSYLWLHKEAKKIAKVREVEAASKALFEKYGAGRTLPDRYRNLDFLYDSWTSEELKNLVGPSLGNYILDERNP